MANTKEKINAGEKDYLEIDLMRILHALWHRAWAIVLAVAVLGGVFYWYAAFMVRPTYTASAKLYVNNQDLSSKVSFSASDQTAAQKLVNTYVVILKTRLVLEEVIAKENLNYTYDQLYSMISAKAVNETEIFEIAVDSEDPKEAAAIANRICDDVLPRTISEIIEKSSVRTVDRAVVPSQKSSPNVTGFTVIGMLIGFVGSALVILITELMNQYIHSEEYLMQTFEDIPVLAVIPDLEGGTSKERYYYRSHKKGE